MMSGLPTEDEVIVRKKVFKKIYKHRWSCVCSGCGATISSDLGGSYYNLSVHYDGRISGGLRACSDKCVPSVRSKVIASISEHDEYMANNRALSKVSYSLLSRMIGRKGDV